MVEQQLPRLSELVSLDVELVEELGIEGDVEDGPEDRGGPSSLWQRMRDKGSLINWLFL